jgi:hypothetical protein
MVFLGFMKSKSDTSLSVYRSGADTVHLLPYVNYIIHTASHSDLLQSTTTALRWEFAMKDLGPLHHFLGVSVE